MKRLHYLLILFVLILPLMGAGQQTKKASEYKAKQSNIAAPVALHPENSLSTPAALTQHPDSSKHEKPKKKLKAKDFKKPKVSRKTSKRKARRAKTS